MSIEEGAVWSRPDDGTAPLIVLLHGRGGTEQDLVRLFPFLPDDVVAVSLRGPLPRRDGYSWFSVPPDPGGRPAKEAAAEHVAPASDAVLAWIAERDGSTVARVDGSTDAQDEIAPRRPVAVVGYSQGGAVAIHMMRRAPRAVDTAVLIAALLGTGDEEGDDVLLEVRPPVYWMRGLRDEAITLMDVQRVAYFLPPHSTLTTAEHPLLGHDLSDTFLAAAGAYVTRWVDGLARSED
ncbi:alpha/beta fold hydrolase [Labedella phragmitis]|uniref:Alpha/beta fold hydrolase n=1 Tax=Labedella phragmitis TaxID=2498849 RepID=A0A3S3ZAF7_9MICO|nr:alpha/beta fold hydrolase [Labedella phragmitis]RWZ52402.1 alpha/beta fold hydrolase [Labedella phragmitis]